MELNGSKRMQASESASKAMLGRIRKGEDITEGDVSKLMSLHMETMKEKHGLDVVKEIEDRALFLFYTNAKRIRHNFERLSMFCSEENPVAVLRSTSTGSNAGKGYKHHFDGPLKPCAFLCKGCKVAIEDVNYVPEWGLHNGACGTVDEIIFKEGCNPNHGDFPEYVIIDFPLYCGPTWDKNNPTVSSFAEYTRTTIPF